MQQKAIDLVMGWEVAYFIPPLHSICSQVINRQPANFLRGRPANLLDFTFSSDTLSKKKHTQSKSVLKTVFLSFSCAEHHQPGGWDLPALAGHSCRRQRDANTDHATHWLVPFFFSPIFSSVLLQRWDNDALCWSCQLCFIQG